VSITIGATYENGVLKPDAPLGLQEKAKVRVTIEEPMPASSDEDDPTGWKAIDALRGIVRGAPKDVSENHDKYLYGDAGE
jgi:predicted DNA-binding antitoxin AbrB/MazE fold protein